MATKKKRNGSKRGQPGDEQVTILRAIWNEMKALNARVEKTNERLDQTNELERHVGLDSSG
jgi:hypothetical protein